MTLDFETTNLANRANVAPLGRERNYKLRGMETSILANGLKTSEAGLRNEGCPYSLSFSSAG